MSDQKTVKITQDTVKYVAHLARIELKNEELKVLARQLEEIIEFIDKLKQVDIDKINPTSHILPLENVLREDKERSSLLIDGFLEQAPKKEGKFFKVPKVIE